ncbi:glutathione S-transferase family protein [Sulfurirhabdus autotrophica]|uniref:Glutathione S-transferase n=1 Tax=Sulfurirhabdus autotrophica TaxID=1706046 RepID=A0A4R3XXL7_9PROT|nr:glutathione S-transferase family protein [Sulfurirhabdus autotrophica]TCV84076.1 glutathione S-transferase [Sulfurirhabdus autotrophica]
MKLYGHPYSNAARRVQMFCEECKIPYTYQMVDLMKGEQYAPEYLALNPNGKVPVIEDDDFVLWESNTIMRYLADKHKAESWYPRDAKSRSQVDQWLDWSQTRLGPEAGKIMFNTHFAGENGNKQAIEDGKKWLQKILPVMNALLSKQTYLCGEAITLADLAAVTNVAYLEMCRYELDEFPAVCNWYSSMKQRPSFVATVPK